MTLRCPCSLRRQAWDLAVDICLSQLPTIIEEGTAFRVSPGTCGALPWRACARADACLSLASGVRG